MAAEVETVRCFRSFRRVVREEGRHAGDARHKIIEETISLGKTDTNNAKAALARATADLAKAEIAANGYEQGRFRSQMQSLEKQLETAKWNLDSAQKMMASSEALFRKGYVTDLELKDSRTPSRRRNWN